MIALSKHIFLVKVHFTESSKIGAMDVARNGTDIGAIFAETEEQAVAKAQAAYQAFRPSFKVLDIAAEEAQYGPIMQDLKFAIP